VSRRTAAAVFGAGMLALAGYLSATATSADPPATTTAPPTTAPATTASPPPTTTAAATAPTTTTTTSAPPAATTAVATTATAATTVTTATPRATKPPPPPRLSVSRVLAGGEGATVGSTLSYTVVLKNTSKTGTGASITDTIPDSVVLVGADADQSGSCSSSGAQVTCGWEAVNPNVTATAVIVMQVVRAGPVANSVEVKAADSTATFDYGPDFAPVTAGQGVAIRFASG